MAVTTSAGNVAVTERDRVIDIVVDILERLGIELPQRPGIGEEDRGDAGKRTRTEGAGEEQRPDQHVDGALEIEEPLDDLVHDPGELANVVDEPAHHERLAELRSLLLAWTG